MTNYNTTVEEVGSIIRMERIRNGLRYALYLLDGKAPKYECITMEENK